MRTEFKSFAKDVGFWWLGMIGLIGDLVFALGVQRPNPPAGVLAAIGLAFVLIGAFRAYRKVAQERDALKPTVDLTVAFEAPPHADSFAGHNCAQIDDVWITDHADKNSILEFVLELSWSTPDPWWEENHVFTKDPFQGLYRQDEEHFGKNYFSNPWHVRKNLQRHLVFLPKQEPTLISDNAMLNF